MPGSEHDPERFLATDHLIEDIAGRSIRGGIITVVAQVAKTALQFGAILLLARLLSPDEFGVIAMAVAVLAFFELFREIGPPMAVVQEPKITHVEVSTLFWINVGVCAAIVLATLALAPALARFYERPELTTVTIWLGVAVAVAGLSTYHLAILRRQMRLAALAATEIGAATAGILAAVVVAIVKGGLWALVAQRLTWAVVLLLASWTICGWRPGMPSRRIDLRGRLGFAGKVTLAGILNLAARTLDHILIGWWAGAHALGLYERANKLLMAPIQNINTPLFAVAMPMLSRLRDSPARYRRAYLNVLEPICMVTMPLAALIIAAPDWIVSLLLGQAWIGAAPIVMWLGVAALFTAASNTTGWLFVTQDRTRELVHWSLYGSGLKLAAIVAGLGYGAEGIAAALAISGLVVRTPLLFWMVGREGPVRTADLYRAVLPSSVAALAVIGSVWGLRHVPELLAADPLLDLVLATGLAAAVSVLCYAGLPRGRRALRGFRTIKSAFLRAAGAPP